MKVSIGKIRIDNNDGTWCEVGFEMPSNVADDIVSQIISWKHDYSMTYMDYREYDHEMSKFLIDRAQEKPETSQSVSQDAKPDEL